VRHPRAHDVDMTGNPYHCVVASWQQRGACVPGPRAATARVLIAGDTHGNLDWIGTLCKLAVRHGCEGIIQLGDFGLWPNMRVLRSENRAVINHGWLTAVAERCTTHGVWMRVIDGNHDAHPLARDAFPVDDAGIRSLRDGVLDWADRGAVWTWCGVRFGALGGGVSIDRQSRVEGRSWWPTEVITGEQIDALEDRAGAQGLDILLTHDSPVLPGSLRPLSDPVMAADCARSIRCVIDAVARTRPTVVLHGHYHVGHRAVLDFAHGSVRVDGFASDEESHDPHGRSWGVLELPSLGIVDAWR